MRPTTQPTLIRIASTRARKLHATVDGEELVEDARSGRRTNEVSIERVEKLMRTARTKGKASHATR